MASEVKKSYKTFHGRRTADSTAVCGKVRLNLCCDGSQNHEIAEGKATEPSENYLQPMAELVAAVILQHSSQHVGGWPRRRAQASAKAHSLSWARPRSR